MIENKCKFVKLLINGHAPVHINRDGTVLTKSVFGRYTIWEYDESKHDYTIQVMAWGRDALRTLAVFTF